MLKVHTVKNTVFKDRFSEIAFGQLYIDHLHIDKFCSHQPGRAEFRAYKNGLVEACTGKVIGIQDAVGKVCPVKTGRSEEHTSELQSLMRISYAVFCLKKKKRNKQT